MLIEIHVLQNHAPSNLNRDDTGSPKECVFGGYKRGRISSQCLKRTIRRSDIFQQALAGDGLATRTRQLPEEVKKAFEADSALRQLAEEAAKKASGFGNKDGKEAAQDAKSGKYLTAQSMFLTQRDIDAVVSTLRNAAEGKTPKEFQALKAADLQKAAVLTGYRPVTVDMALFGRMTTSEAFRDVEAACQVAHALSTHKVDHEFDYFTAVDDLQGVSETQEDAGADMIGDVEFNSACYYKYFSIDVEALVDNLTGAGPYRRKEVPQVELAAARDLAARTAAALVKALVMVTPTGKQNSFAAHQLPSAVLVEVRPGRTPVSYANAFVEPARAGKGDDLVRASLHQFGPHVEALTTGFNLEATARLILAPEHPDFAISGTERISDLNHLAARLTEAIKSNEAVKAAEVIGHG